jgi:hypothetical protein
MCEDESDDISEYCAECRNVEIYKSGIVCLGSDGYRRRKGCLDIQIKWMKDGLPDEVNIDNGESNAKLS